MLPLEYKLFHCLKHVRKERDDHNVQLCTIFGEWQLLSAPQVLGLGDIPSPYFQEPSCQGAPPEFWGTGVGTRMKEPLILYSTILD